MKVQVPLQSTDAALLNEFANSFETRRRILNILINNYYAIAIKNATELIGTLKREYHLK